MTIFISQKFVSILGDASEGGIPGHMVMIFIGLKTPDLAGMMLPLSLFLGILLAYGRIYAESEMTVLHACGVSEWYVVRITLILAFITAMLTGLFTLYLGPMASEYEYQVKEKLAADSGLSTLVAGRFQRTGNEDAVVFIHDKDRNSNELQKVFVAQLPKKEDDNTSIIQSSLVYATAGKVIESEGGSQELILGKGKRYQQDENNSEFSVVSFDEYHIQIQDQKVEQRRRKVSAVSTIDLFTEEGPEYKAAIHWRLAFPIACLILTFVAVPLSVVNPRQGKFAKLVPALLLFLTYFLILTSLRSGLESGVIPNTIGMWPVHAVAGLLGISLLMRERTSGRRLKAKVKRKRGAQ